MEQLQAVVENRTGFCLDPRTKLLLMAVVATAEFLYSHTAFMIAVAMIPFVLLLTNRQYKTATVFFCLFAAGLFVQAIQNSVQFPMIVTMLVVLLVGLVLRLFPALVALRENLCYKLNNLPLLIRPARYAPGGRIHELASDRR